jgi:hypothetical protein
MPEAVQQTLYVVAGVLTLAGFIPYIYSIFFRGKTPVIATWLIYAVLDVITFASMYAKNSHNGQVIGSMIGCNIIFLLSLRRGENAWKMLDVICLAASAVGLILWYAFNNPMFALLMSLAIVTIGSIPTFAMIWKDHKSESLTAWSIWLLSSIAQLSSLEKWSIEYSAQPLSYLFVQATALLFMYLAPRPSVSS